MFKASPRQWFLYCLSFLIFVAGLAALFYLYVNGQAEKKWAEEIASLKAKGEKTDWREFVPPQVPDSENFCATPILACLFDYTKEKDQNEPNYAHPELVEKIKEVKPSDSTLNDYPSNGSMTAKTLTDLKKWQDHFQKSKVFPHPEPSAKTTPAEVVIIALNKYQKELNELIEASHRPEARFALHYGEEPKITMNISYISAALDVSNTLSLRASAYLRSGQSAKAWADLQVLLKFQQACGKEPMLISHLVGLTITGITVNGVWEGLALNAWSAAELEQISRRLEPIDFLTEYQHCMRGETIFFILPTLEYLKKDGVGALAEILGNEDLPQGGRLVAKAIPNGCFDMAKVASVQTLYGKVLPIIDAKNRRYDFATAALLEAEDKKFNSYSPVDIILRLTAPTSISYAQKLVEAQANVDMARISCALELFQRKNGRYPSDLAALKQPLPNDIITGNPYFYKLTPNGRYQLWSVGWNQTNDLGVAVFKDKEKKRRDPQNGDWVWAYPDEKPSF